MNRQERPSANRAPCPLREDPVKPASSVRHRPPVPCSLAPHARARHVKARHARAGHARDCRIDEARTGPRGAAVDDRGRAARTPFAAPAADGVKTLPVAVPHGAASAGAMARASFRNRERAAVSRGRAPIRAPVSMPGWSRVSAAGSAGDPLSARQPRLLSLGLLEVRPGRCTRSATFPCPARRASCARASTCRTTPPPPPRR